MGSVVHPRGRLPRRVYWVRRSVVLLVALVLVFGIGKLLGGNGKDPASPDVQASTSSAEQDQPSSAASIGPVAPSKAPGKKSSASPLLPANGECRDDEVSVTPTVEHAWGLKPIVIHLALQGLQPACSFTVSPESVVVKITSGDDRIWSSQDCPTAIPDTDVVVRSGIATNVDVTWNGRRSDTGCPAQTDWADGGFYHAYAAVLGSTPTDVQFEVTRAPTKTVTKTAKPKPSNRPSNRPSASTSANAKPSGKSTSGVSGKESKCGGDNAAGSC